MQPKRVREMSKGRPCDVPCALLNSEYGALHLQSGALSRMATMKPQATSVGRSSERRRGGFVVMALT